MEAAAALRELPLGTRPISALQDHLTAPAWNRLRAAHERARALLGSRTLWIINSTPQGGGVAEMISNLTPYWRGSGIDVRWLVIHAPPPFYELTKRIHNLLHGVSEPHLGPRDQALFEQISHTLASQALELVAPGDLVILEDPQTAGLAPMLRQAGAVVVWRCHVGTDWPNDPVAEAWRFLLPFLDDVDVAVFTRREFVPPELEQRAMLVMPAIDPASAKNQPMAMATARAALDRCGLVRAGHGAGAVRVPVAGGRTVSVHRPCAVVREGRPPRLVSEPLVVALARWDRLKDPIGVLRGFAEHVDHPDARLIVAGPATTAVADDPDQERVFTDAHAAWKDLPRSRRRRIDLARLPMDDIDENAIIVNALQRHAAVVVKKSLEEGFGLGVTEGMWKARPVVATRVGGHQSQIEHRRTGLLVDDPHDLPAFGAAIDELLCEPAEALEMASVGRENVRRHFLADRHFVDWTAVLLRAVT